MVDIAVSELLFRPLDCGHKFFIKKVWYLQIGDYPLEVPEGFITDLASVPRILWALFPRWGKHGFGAVIHDWLYVSGEVSRAEADWIFNEMMKHYNVRRLQRYMMYWAVRAFGWIGWNRNRRK
jgi:hypothetical protein